MKKAINIIVLTVFLSGLASAFDIGAKLKLSYFRPFNEYFHEIYVHGIMFGGELNIGIFGPLEAWLGASYFSKEGELTVTGEKTKLQIIPIGGGIKYNFSIEDWIIYVGVGLNNYHYKEESETFGKTEKNGLGFLGMIEAAKKITGGLFLSLHVEYSYCKMQPDDPVLEAFNIGGIKTGIGLGYKF